MLITVPEFTISLPRFPTVRISAGEHNICKDVTNEIIG